MYLPLPTPWGGGGTCWNTQSITSPVYGTTSWCPMCRLPILLTVLTSFRKFKLFESICPIHSPLGCIKKKNYEGLNQRANFIIRFVDPVENTGILIESYMFFVDESNKINNSYFIHRLVAPYHVKIQESYWMST